MSCVNPSRFSLRARGIAAYVAFALCGVAAAGYQTTAPADVTLTGAWKINPQLSDDPQKLLEEKREQAKERMAKVRGSMGGMSASSSGASGGIRSSQGDREAMRARLEQQLVTNEHLEIEQHPEVMLLILEDRSEACGSPETSQVSMPDGGLADRRCGWDGKAFVIELKSSDGFTRRDRYTLSEDGKTLTLTTELKGGRMSGLTIKRVYERDEST